MLNIPYSPNIPCRLNSPEEEIYTIRGLHLDLSLGLGSQILVQTESDDGAHEDEGVETDARGGSVGCRCVLCGLAVGFGCWVAGLVKLLALHLNREAEAIVGDVM